MTAPVYKTITSIDTETNLFSLPADIGVLGYAEDTKRHYMNYGTGWAKIPNPTEIVAASTKGYVNGIWQSGIFPFLAKAMTNSSGVATVYLTDNGMATGSAVFANIFQDGIVAMPVGISSNYQVTSVTISNDRKMMTIAINQLGTVALGLVSVVSAAAGVEVRVVVMGS